MKFTGPGRYLLNIDNKKEVYVCFDFGAVIQARKESNFNSFENISKKDFDALAIDCLNCKKDKQTQIETAPLTALLDIHEACKYLGISNSTIRRLIKGNDLQFNRIGNLYKFTKDQLDEYLSRTGKRILKIGSAE